jgi:hypothetical protein
MHNKKQILLSLFLAGSITPIIMPAEKAPEHPAPTPIDVRTFLLQQRCNQKDENGQTFFYKLAATCATFTEWQPMANHLERYTQQHTGAVPNPFIGHEEMINGEKRVYTAKQKAKEQFTKTGNPTCKVLAEFLSEREIMFVDISSSKQGRQLMINQQIYPDAQHNSVDTVIR